MVQKEVQFRRDKFCRRDRVGFTGPFGVHPVFGVCPRRLDSGSPAPPGSPASGAKGRAAGWGRGRRGDKGRGHRAPAGGCGGELPRRCTPALRETRTAMERPWVPPGPTQAEPAGPPPAPPPPPPPPPLPRPAAPAAAPSSANMAAAPIGRDTLPEHWSYGVCRDGRVFFIKCGAGMRGRWGGGGAGKGCGARRAPPGRRWR